MTRPSPPRSARPAVTLGRPQAPPDATGRARQAPLALRLPWGLPWTLPVSLLLLILTLSPEAFPGAHPASAVTLFLSAPGLLIIPRDAVKERTTYWTLVTATSVLVNFGSALLLLYTGGFTRPKLLLASLLLTLLLAVLARSQPGREKVRPRGRRQP